MLPSILNSLAIIVSLGTATGVLVHDMHVDNALSQFALPAHAANYDSASHPLNFGDQHIHVERAQAFENIRNDAPSIQPRVLEDKKHLLQNRAPRGHHAFDNYNLPIV